MITSLVIKNFALIEDIRVEFQDGLTVITGETGAGKSILLDALGLLLGDRADLRSVKDSSKKCIVEGHFLIEKYDMISLFEENELDYEPNTIIRREILPSGKSRVFVNDTPVTLSQLQALGIRLVDIHSQHQTMEIGSEEFQLEVLDILAENSQEIKLYHKELVAYRKLVEKLKTLESEKESSARELDYNSFLLKELEEASLKSLKQEELEEAYETLNNSEEIQEAFIQVNKLFSEEQIGALEAVKEARIVLGKIKSYASLYENQWERLNSLVIEMEDLSEELERASDKIEADPEMLFQINEKLQLLYKLQQKHGVASVSELIEIQNNLEEKINKTLNLDSEIIELENKKEFLKANTKKIAERIHVNRERAIPGLKKQLEEILAPLGLQNANFHFELQETEEFRKNGIDSLDLLFSANKGLAPGSIKKIASGGEMSRIMLAVKAVLGKYKKLPTIIFDEIDTGVSGEIANKMADIMKEMSQGVQLFSITHLPQVAAKGEHHLKVYKEDKNDITVTRLKNLNPEERIAEIAEMLGGKNVSTAALANARELLN